MNATTACELEWWLFYLPGYTRLYEQCVHVCLWLLGSMPFGIKAAPGVHYHYLVILVQLQAQRLDK